MARAVAADVSGGQLVSSISSGAVPPTPVVAAAAVRRCPPTSSPAASFFRGDGPGERFLLPAPPDAREK